MTQYKRPEPPPPAPDYEEHNYGFGPAILVAAIAWALICLTVVRW